MVSCRQTHTTHTAVHISNTWAAWSGHCFTLLLTCSRCSCKYAFWLCCMSVPLFLPPGLTIYQALPYVEPAVHIQLPFLLMLCLPLLVLGKMSEPAFGLKGTAETDQRVWRLFRLKKIQRFILLRVFIHILLSESCLEIYMLWKCPFIILKCDLPSAQRGGGTLVWVVWERINDGCFILDVFGSTLLCCDWWDDLSLKSFEYTQF